MEQQVLEGTWEEVSRHGPELTGKRVRLTILPDQARTARADTHPHQQIRGFYFGVFSGDPQPTEEDFRSAEFHGDPDDGLDWK